MSAANEGGPSWVKGGGKGRAGQVVGGCAHRPQLLLHLPVQGVGADPPPRLDGSVQRLHRHLVILEVDKDGVVGAPSPAQANEVLTRDGGVVVAFPGGRGGQ